MFKRLTAWIYQKPDPVPELSDAEFNAALDANPRLKAEWEQWLREFNARRSMPDNEEPFDGLPF